MIDVLHICVAMKPVKGSVSSTACKYGVGVLNISDCRIGYNSESESFGIESSNYDDKEGGFGFYKGAKKQIRSVPPGEGRHPANIIHDGSSEIKELFPVTSSGERKAGQPRNAQSKTSYVMPNQTTKDYPASQGSASRFFKECSDD